MVRLSMRKKKRRKKNNKHTHTQILLYAEINQVRRKLQSLPSSESGLLETLSVPEEDKSEFRL